MNKRRAYRSLDDIVSSITASPLGVSIKFNSSRIVRWERNWFSLSVGNRPRDWVHDIWISSDRLSYWDSRDKPRSLHVLFASLSQPPVNRPGRVLTFYRLPEYCIGVWLSLLSGFNERESRIKSFRSGPGAVWFIRQSCVDCVPNTDCINPFYDFSAISFIVEKDSLVWVHSNRNPLVYVIRKSSPDVCVLIGKIQRATNRRHRSLTSPFSLEQLATLGLVNSKLDRPFEFDHWFVGYGRA